MRKIKNKSKLRNQFTLKAVSTDPYILSVTKTDGWSINVVTKKAGQVGLSVYLRYTFKNPTVIKPKGSGVSAASPKSEPRQTVTHMRFDMVITVGGAQIPAEPQRMVVGGTYDLGAYSSMYATSELGLTRQWRSS